MTSDVDATRGTMEAYNFDTGEWDTLVTRLVKPTEEDDDE